MKLKATAIAVFIVAVLAAAALPRGIAYVVRTKVLPRVEARFGVKVHVGRLGFGLGRLIAEDVVVGQEGAAPFVVVPRAEVRVRLMALLVGRAEVADLLVDRPRIEIVRTEAQDNFSRVLSRLREKKTEGAGSGGGERRTRVDRVRVLGGSLWALDEAAGEVRIGSFDATLPFSGIAEVRLRDAVVELGVGPRASAQKLTFSIPLAEGRPVKPPTVTLAVDGGAATLARGLTLTGISGTIGAEDAAKSKLTVDLKGSYAGATVPLWNARGSIDPAARAANVKVRAERFKLSQLEDVLKNADGTSQLVGARDAEADASLDLEYADAKLAFKGSVNLEGLTVAHPALAPTAVPGIGASATISGRLDTRERTLDLDELVVQFRKVHAILKARIENVGSKPRVQATLAVAPLPCQTVLEAIPAELTPVLQGFKVAGTFSTDLHFGVDLGDLDIPVDLGGRVGIEGCRVTSAPSGYSADRLTKSFEQTVEHEQGKWMTFFAGPENPDFVPYAEISTHLVNSIMTTEDNGFFRHRGFIPSEFRTALQQNLQRGYFRLGASSISMQMVKNVLLSREKTLSRKLQELFLTWYLEKNLSKERILEIYFNVIEFGPGIFGIGRATRHYFGKTPKELEPVEAAWFSSILPNPKKRYVQFCHTSGQVDAKWDNYLKRILRRNHERGRITDDEYQKAIAAPLKFSRLEATPERECMALVKRITTPAVAPVAAPPAR